MERPLVEVLGGSDLTWEDEDRHGEKQGLESLPPPPSCPTWQTHLPSPLSWPLL